MYVCVCLCVGGCDCFSACLFVSLFICIFIWNDVQKVFFKGFIVKKKGSINYKLCYNVH